MKEFDILIIGAGGAGSAAAIEARKNSTSVCILCKSLKVNNKTAKAQGGIQASFGEGDSEENHFKDTLKAGLDNKPKLVKTLVENAKNTVRWLENLGVEFDKNNNSYILKKGAGMSHARVLSCGDLSGNRIIKPLHKKIKDLKIPVFENCIVTNIKKSKAHFLVEYKKSNSDNKKYSFFSKAIILATGGDLTEEKKSGLKTNNQKYDGKSIVRNLNIVYKNQDLKQYHPLGVIYPVDMKREVLPENMRFEGAKLINKNKKELTNSKGLRGDLTNEIIEQCKLGLGVNTNDGYTGVWLTTSEIEKKNRKGFIKKRYPNLWKKFSKINYDISRKDLLVYPILHYSLGGIDINEKTETNVKGVFAAGEATWGVHGKERIMGNSLTDIFVFGRIAGKNAASYVKNKK